MQHQLSILMLSSFMIMSCSGNQVKDDDPKVSTNMEMEEPQKEQEKEKDAGLVMEIKFQEGLKAIPGEEKQKIEELYKRASKLGIVDSVKVITWGDSEFLSDDNEELLKKQQKLIEDRNDNIEAFLEKFNDQVDVDKFSMAESPEMLQRLFSSEDERIKDSLESAGIPDSDTTQKMSGQASKSIVMVILKEYLVQR